MKEFLIKNRLIFIIIIASIFLFTLSFTTYNLLKKNVKPLLSTEQSVYNTNIIKDEVSVEINGELPNINTFFTSDDNLNDFPTITYYKEGTIVDVDLSKFDTYDVKIIYQNNEYSSTLKIVDTTPPVVGFGKLNIKEGDRYIARHFIKSYSDNSKSNNYSVSYKKSSDANITSPGTYKIELLVCDDAKNCIEGNTELTIYANNSDKKYVKSETENIVIKEEYIKYGVKKITTAEVTYSIYDDNSKEEVTRSDETTSFDYSGYNHSYLEEMKKEATALYEEQASSRNEILNRINSYRREKGVSALVIDKKLSILATVRAMEIAYSGTFSYKRPYIEEEYQSYTSFWLEDIFDFPFDINNLIGENLGYHYSNDSNIAEAWHNSKIHNDVLTNSKYTKTGIGKYTLNGETYWVELFVEA